MARDRLTALAPAPRDVRRALAALGVAAAVAALAAVVTALGFAPAARRTLAFGFAGQSPRWSETTGIFLHNARLTGVVAAAIVVVQAPRLGVADAPLRPGGRALRLLADAALAAVVAVNAAVVGVCAGAYGPRLVPALLPHGPVEVAAYALALALYLRAREERLAPRPALVLAAWTVSLLVLAALLEAPPPL